MLTGDAEEERAERHAQHLARARNAGDLAKMLSERKSEEDKVEARERKTTKERLRAKDGREAGREAGRRGTETRDRGLRE
eukprot:747822-Hanusia_phi.AAC.2